MVLKADQLRVKALLKETITLLCKNGLNYRSEFAIEALIGITLDKDDVFLISIKEKIGGKFGAIDTSDAFPGEEKQDFEIDFVARDTSSVDDDDEIGGEEQDVSNSSTVISPKWIKPDPQDANYSTDSTSAVVQNSNLNETLADVDNLPTTRCEQAKKTQTAERIPRVDDSSVECKVKVECNDDDDDDIVMIKEELPVDVASHIHSSYSLATQTSASGLTTQTFSSSWSTPLTDMSASYSTPPTLPQRLAGPSSHTVNFQLPPTAQQTHRNTTAFVVKPYKCSTCDKRFLTAKGLSLHEDLHRGRYRYYCKLCGKGFSGHTYLRGHMASHTGVREFRCHLCAAEYLYARGLKYHMQAQHPGVPVSIAHSSTTQWNIATSSIPDSN